MNKRIIRGYLKNLNLKKSRELETYERLNSQLVRDLLDNRPLNELRDDEAYMELPRPLFNKTISLVEEGRVRNLYGSKVKGIRLVIGCEDWSLFKVGKCFSLVLPFSEGTLRVPLKLLSKESEVILSSMKLGSKEIVGVNTYDLYVYRVGLTWNVDMLIECSLHS